MQNLEALTHAELLARVQVLERERATRPGTGLKVSEKGAVSFYGAGRFPVTLYASQWETVLAKADIIREFITANHDQLSHKPAKGAAA
jgi:hypothetical protein